jgi:Nucleotide-diphospho-sugar transferase
MIGFRSFLAKYLGLSLFAMSVVYNVYDHHRAMEAFQQSVGFGRFAYHVDSCGTNSSHGTHQSEANSGTSSSLSSSPDAAKIKMIAISNHKYHEVAFAWYDRMQELGYTEHVIVATDNTTVAVLSGSAAGDDDKSPARRHRNYEVWLTPPLSEEERKLPVQTQRRNEQHKMFGWRWHYILEQLRSGYSILLTDVDNIFVRYVPLQSFLGYDVIHAYSTPWPEETFRKIGLNVCGGMVWLQATGPTILYVERIVETCGVMCDDQILINRMLAFDLNVTWDEPVVRMRANHSQGKFTGLSYKERTGQSQVTGHTIKIWPMDFAYRGPMFPDVCPGPKNWVAMPEDHGRGLTRNTIHQHKLTFFATWAKHCGNNSADDLRPIGLAAYEVQYSMHEVAVATCLKNTLRFLPIGSGRTPSEIGSGRDMVFANHHSAGNDELWNDDIRFEAIVELKTAPCNVWEVGANTVAADSQQFFKDYPHCSFHVYEPFLDFFQPLQQRWENEPRMKVHNYGLGAKNSTFITADRLTDEGTYIGESTTESMEAKVVALDAALQEADSAIPTLFHINCKGMTCCVFGDDKCVY